MTGGEIFLRKDVVEATKIILSYCKDLYHLHIPTNVVKSELTINNIKEIYELKPNKFTVTLSLDGPEKTHDYIRGIPGNFNSVMKAYRSLKSLQNRRFEIFFGFTLSKLNFGKFPETVETVRKLFPEVSYKNFHMNLAHSSENYYKNTNLDLGVTNNYNILKEQFEFFRQRKKQFFNPINLLENLYLINLRNYLKTGIIPMECKSLSSSVYLDPYGNIYPCSIWEKRLGNIRDFNYNLLSILEQNFINEIKNEIKNKNCPNCWTPCEAYQTIFGNLSSVAKQVFSKSKV
jgi:radical SAM protein with 4Fe4S-binding SPASM domain